MFSAKLKANSLVLLLSVLVVAQPALAEERYMIMMDGKPVSRSMYEAVLLLKDGTIKLKSNDNAGAVESFRHAAKLAPEFPEVQHNLGIALAKVGKSKEAIVHLEKARKLNPKLASTWLSLGGLYQTEGRIYEALNTYKQYLSRFPNDPAAKKVSSLVKGLTSEAEAEGYTGSQKTQQEDNYLNEITRRGVVRWSASKMPLHIYIKPGDGVPEYKPEYYQLLIEAFKDWQKASSGLVSFKFVENKDSSDIQCSWTNNPKDLNNIAEAGETRLSSTSRGIVRGTIKFLTVPLMKSLPVTKNRMRYIFLHEIGHVLGMAGHTNNPSDTMFYSMNLKDEWKDLSSRDAKTIQMLYSQPESSISYK